MKSDYAWSSLERARNDAMVFSAPGNFLLVEDEPHKKTSRADQRVKMLLSNIDLCYVATLKEIKLFAGLFRR